MVKDSSPLVGYCPRLFFRSQSPIDLKSQEGVCGVSSITKEHHCPTQYVTHSSKHTLTSAVCKRASCAQHSALVSMRMHLSTCAPEAKCITQYAELKLLETLQGERAKEMTTQAIHTHNFLTMHPQKAEMGTNSDSGGKQDDLDVRRVVSKWASEYLQ